MIIAKAPGTCGEYLQGIYRDQPALISSPIDLFSETTISKGTGKRKWQEKAKKAYDVFFEKFGIPIERGTEIDICIVSPLPVEKGMASSTADILSLLYALDAYFRTGMTEDQAAQIAITIEPSDNVMYRELNLFNHYTGEILEEYEGFIEANVLILDFELKVNTIDFGYDSEFKKSSLLSEVALDLFKEGLLDKDLKKIGQATTISALNNQTALKHPYFKTIWTIAEKFGGLGILIGHSGSVLGILYDENFNKNDFIKELTKKVPENIIVNILDQKLIQGGVRVERLPE